LVEVGGINVGKAEQELAATLTLVCTLELTATLELTLLEELDMGAEVEIHGCCYSLKKKNVNINS